MVTVRRPAWVLELDEGQWRGEPPRGRLRLHVVGISRNSTPGFVIVSGWRQFEDRESKFCRVLVCAELAVRSGGMRTRWESL